MRFQSFLGLVTAIVVFSLLGLTFFVVTKGVPTGGIFSSEALRGSAVVKEGTPYTLNFAQQQRLLAQLDQSRPYAGEPASLGPVLPVERIVLYGFDGVEWELVPRGWIDSEMIFYSSLHKQMMQDKTQGQLFQLLQTTYE